MEKNNEVEEISGHSFNDFIKENMVLVDFFAEWCMPCLMLAPVVEEMAEKFSGKIKFGKINIDNEADLASKFGVMSIPTLIVFKDGVELDRIMGAMPAEQLEEKLNSLL